jgi:hypothetical protein
MALGVHQPQSRIEQALTRLLAFDLMKIAVHGLEFEIAL